MNDTKQEIEGWLQDALINARQISLDKQLQPEQVQRFRDIKIGLKLPENLASDVSILDIFDRVEISGRLLILGEPGSGKTTTLYQLARELMHRAESDPVYPIPVVLSLSSWKVSRQPVVTWFVEELKKRGVRQDVAKSWIEAKQILPLLDGLDDIEPTKQINYVEAINLWQQSEYRPRFIVVCCRREEYEKVIRGHWQEEEHNQTDERRLKLNGAVLLKELTDEQIQTYLIDLNQAEFWLRLEQNHILKGLARIPFWLNIILLSYEEISFDGLEQSNSMDEHQALLISTYVGRMLHRDLFSQAYTDCQVPNIDKTNYWLAYLAKQMQTSKEQSSDFLLENIQPYWLSSFPQWIVYIFLCEIVHISLFLLGTGLHAIISVGIKLDTFSILYTLEVLKSCIRLGFFYGTIAALLPIQVTETSYSLSSLVKVARTVILTLLILTLNTVLLSPEEPNIIFDGFVKNGFVYLPVTMGFLSLSRKRVETKTQANEGIRRTFYDVVFIGAVSFLITCLGLWSVQISPVDINLSLFALRDGLFSGIAVAIILGMYKGGTNIIKHYAIRFVLWMSGHIPWNYVRFLDYCSERLLLQRIGGRYRFIHRYVQKHFESS
ncbi:NACHT domain-containing protein [Phormidesmis sp. 146-12]